MAEGGAMIRRLVARADNDSVLARWRGANAMVWQFSPTFRRLALRLYRRELPEELYVMGVGCRRISGPMEWQGADLDIVELGEHEHEREHEASHRLQDEKAGFSLWCGGVVLLLVPPGADPFNGPLEDAT